MYFFHLMQIFFRVFTYLHKDDFAVRGNKWVMMKKGTKSVFIASLKSSTSCILSGMNDLYHSLWHSCIVIEIIYEFLDFFYQKFVMIKKYFRWINL